jgi:hypothetical protein
VSVDDIISVAAVAEALATTFYFHGIRGRIPTLIEADDLSYLKAALSEEKAHLDLLLSAGAAAPPTTFYFRDGTFSQLNSFNGDARRPRDGFHRRLRSGRPALLRAE